jgi:hypothetical protein
MSLTVGIVKENGAYSLFANGHRYIREESLTVVQNVKYCLENPGREWWTECADVADSIRRDLDGKP